MIAMIYRYGLIEKHAKGWIDRCISSTNTILRSQNRIRLYINRLKIILVITLRRWSYEIVLFYETKHVLFYVNLILN